MCLKCMLNNKWIKIQVSQGLVKLDRIGMAHSRPRSRSMLGNVWLWWCFILCMLWRYATRMMHARTIVQYSWWDRINVNPSWTQSKYKLWAIRDDRLTRCRSCLPSKSCETKGAVYHCSRTAGTNGRSEPASHMNIFWWVAITDYVRHTQLVERN